MSWLFTLWLLYTAHTLLAGFCDVAGRNCLIQKKAYLIKGCVWGFVVGQLLTLPLLALIWLQDTCWPAQELWPALEQAARTLSLVHLAYTALIAATFLLYALPYAEARSLLSVAVFGPLTLILPAVIFSAGLLTAYHHPPKVWPAGLYAVTLAISLRWLLHRIGWAYRSAQQEMGLA